MRIHLDVLGWLYVLCGVAGLLSGTALGILAFGTTAATAALSPLSAPVPPTAWLLIVVASAFGIAGALMVVVGRGLVTRSRFGRHGALALAAFNMFLIPFGTALGMYACWTLLNDEARREFGRPPRSPNSSRTSH